MTRHDAPRLSRGPPVRRRPTLLHGSVVADPYRWLEDADDPETVAWSQAQDDLLRPQHVRPARPRPARPRGCAELLGAGIVGTPAWRGDRQFFMRRTAEQEHAVLLTVDPDGTERVLVDPIAVDPSGATTLDAWQPSKEGHLLAYQLSAGGTEESVLHVMDVATGEPVDGPIDRARYSPVAWLPGGEAFYYVRRLAPELVPDGEEQYHRRVWLHRVGTDPDDRRRDLRRRAGQDQLLRRHGVDGRPLAGRSAPRPAPRRATTCGSPTCPTAGWRRPTLRVVQEGVDASTSLHVGRDGRVYVFTDRDAPRGRLA